MTAGFIQIPRAVLEAGWWKEATPLTRNLWLVLFSLANWRATTTGKGEHLKPGQLVTSWAALAEHLAYKSKGRRIIPTPRRIKWAGLFLKKARVVSWVATGVVSGWGLLLTLEQWASYVEGQELASGVTSGVTSRDMTHLTSTPEEVKDLPPDVSTSGEGKYSKIKDPALRRELLDWDQKCTESLESIAEEQRMQRGEGRESEH